MSAPSGHVDPRGLRVAASITTVVLALAIVTANPFVVAVQLVVFAIAVIFGVARSPYALVFKTLIRPRIAPPSWTEDPRPPWFAQVVGLVFASVALLSLIAGATTLGIVALALALVAAFLNAAFGLCLGCELYLLLIRIRTPRDKAAHEGAALATTPTTHTTTEVSA